METFEHQPGHGADLLGQRADEPGRGTHEPLCGAPAHGLSRRELLRRASWGTAGLTLALSRDDFTGEIITAITLLNRGLSAATNVEITGARLNVRNTLGGALPTRHTRLAPGKTHTEHLRFPALQAGHRAALRLSGRHQGGTFGASLRVPLP